MLDYRSVNLLTLPNAPHLFHRQFVCFSTHDPTGHSQHVPLQTPRFLHYGKVFRIVHTPRQCFYLIHMCIYTKKTSLKFYVYTKKMHHLKRVSFSKPSCLVSVLLFSDPSQDQFVMKICYPPPRKQGLMIRDYEAHHYPLIRPAIRAGYFLGVLRGLGGVGTLRLL